jgi:hypothetical protein
MCYNGSANGMSDRDHVFLYESSPGNGRRRRRAGAAWRPAAAAFGGIENITERPSA